MSSLGTTSLPPLRSNLTTPRDRSDPTRASNITLAGTFYGSKPGTAGGLANSASARGTTAETLAALRSGSSEPSERPVTPPAQTFDEFLAQLSAERALAEYRGGSSGESKEERQWPDEFIDDSEDTREKIMRQDELGLRSDGSGWGLPRKEWPRVELAGEANDGPKSIDAKALKHWESQGRSIERKSIVNALTSGPPPPERALDSIHLKLKRAIPSLKHLDELNDHIAILTEKLQLNYPEDSIQLISDGTESPTSQTSPVQAEPPQREAASAEEGFPKVLEICGISKERLEHASSTFITQLADSYEVPQILDKPPDLKAEQEAKLKASGGYQLIEFNHFPGYTPDRMSPLPNEILAKPIIVAVLSEKTRTDKQFRKWRRRIVSKKCMEIVYDTFWVVFLRIWKAEAENESANKMFLRISQNYVAIFSELKGVDNDEFLEIFPDLLAQTVYRCFCECFPRSTHQFNRDFQIKICDLITEWISGIKPYIPSCVSWKPYIITSQKIQGRMAADSDAAKSHESALDISDTSGYGIDRLGDGIRREKMAPPSCIAGPGPQIRRLWFDTHGNSPIIAKYLEVYGFGSVEKKRIHVHRSEVVRNSVSEDAPTYRQIIMESARNSKRIYRQYLHSQEEAQKERNRMLQELNQQLSKDQRTAWRLLNRPQLVKETADELVEKMHQSIASQAKQKKGVSAVSVGGE